MINYWIGSQQRSGKKTNEIISRSVKKSSGHLQQRPFSKRCFLKPYEHILYPVLVSYEGIAHMFSKSIHFAIGVNFKFQKIKRSYTHVPSPIS